VTTFGVTSVLGTTNNLNPNSVAQGLQYSAPQSGTITSMSVYALGEVNTTGTLYQCIYTDNGSNQPGTILGTTTGVALTSSFPAQWITDTGISVTVVSGTLYWLCAYLVGGSSAAKMYYGALANASYGYFTQQTSPATGFSLISAADGMSIYGTYGLPSGNPPLVGGVYARNRNR
jgi:hypothetical protein